MRPGSAMPASVAVFFHSCLLQLTPEVCVFVCASVCGVCVRG